MNDYIAHTKNGLLFQADSEENLVSQMSQLYRRPDIRKQLSRHAKEFACKQFDREQQQRKLLTVLGYPQSILSGKSPVDLE